MAALLRLVTMFSMNLYSGAALQASAGDITAVLAALKEEGTKVLQQLFRRRRIYWFRAASIGTEPPLLVQSRLYWYRGVTVLLPGKVIWKWMGFTCKMSPSHSEPVTHYHAV